jgi:hypothetical protein
MIHEVVSAILTVRERSYWTACSSLPTVRFLRFLSTPVVSEHSTSVTSFEMQRLKLVSVRVKDRTVTPGAERTERVCRLKGR